MDHVAQFNREVRAFEAAARRASSSGGAPLVPSCPGWSVADLVIHLGAVHRHVHAVVRDRLPGLPDPGDLADAVTQVFEVMAPARRSWTQAPPGTGERYLFRQTDGPGTWAVCFDGADVRLTGGSEGAVELAGTASDLLLHLWRRLPADRLDVRGDRALLDRYFTLVPPV
ncbi:maleylpyruvate isomerase N-terminal domain-containing protein [Nonomuraea sp. NPDC049607]|uniref:maleylpyruvate isomerase N-terminal domain-containing protein n=1 Tax=Nonomuraea sp. NPDC049607 TaxID=3154732 RepID=UPI00342A23B0